MRCIKCDKETTNPKFCSRSCSASYTNKTHPRRKINRKCAKCDNTVRNYRSKLCQKHWDERQQNQKIAIRQRTIGEYRDRIIKKGYAPSNLHAHIRRFARSWFKNLIDQPCAKCGYDKHVELCHIKPVSSFDDDTPIGEVNSKDNIIQLCRNCHWEFDHLYDGNLNVFLD